MTTPNLKTRLIETIYPALSKQLGRTNLLSLPHLKKIVVNIGISKSETSTKDLATAREELTLITGQAARTTHAKQSIAGFKIREHDPIGVSVTLRGQKMYDFLDKLCKIVLPQVKDFRGVKRHAFDGAGNYTLGLTEQIIFPEIDYAKVDKVHGLEITIVTSTRSDNEAFALLKAIGIPFTKNNQQE